MRDLDAVNENELQLQYSIGNRYLKYRLREVMSHGPDIDRTVDMSLRRAVWFAVGSGALAIGALGAVLPVLPTTPFVIVAAFAFGKSSPRLAAWLETSRTFGPMIADWRCHGAIAPRVKALSIAMMAGVFVTSIIVALSVWVLIVQAVCMTGAAVFILSRPNGPA